MFMPINADTTTPVVEVVYASTTQQIIRSVPFSSQNTVEQIIQQSGILQQCPEIDLKKQGVGIFSKRTSLQSRVKAGDRIEIYRALLADPKLARKARVKKKA